MNKKTILLSFGLVAMGLRVTASEKQSQILDRLFNQCPNYVISIHDEYIMALAVAKKAEIIRCPALADLRLSSYHKCLGRGMAFIKGLDIHRGAYLAESADAILAINQSIKKCKETSSL